MEIQTMTNALSPETIAEQAMLLRACYANKSCMAPIREAHSEATIDDAYAIQAMNTAFWEEEGRVVAGAKIGLTSKSVQNQLGVDQPDFGSIFADMEIPDGAAVEPGRLIQPKVEAEIAFIMGRPPNTAKLTTSELINSIAYALPAIEIVDSRIADWNIGIVDTIADNASAGLYLTGPSPVAIDKLDLRHCGMVLEINGEPVSFGAGAACLGNPLNALQWLARKMADLGRPLREGDIVLSGALGPMAAVSPGDYVEARIEGLGAARVKFERGDADA